jgi:hypothetical protein
VNGKPQENMPRETKHTLVDHNKADLIQVQVWDFEINSKCVISSIQGNDYEDGCLQRYCAGSLVGIYRRFRDAYCLHHQDDHRRD